MGNHGLLQTLAAFCARTLFEGFAALGVAGNAIKCHPQLVKTTKKSSYLLLLVGVEAAGSSFHCPPSLKSTAQTTEASSDFVRPSQWSESQQP